MKTNGKVCALAIAFSLSLTAAEPAPQDQVAMQRALKSYVEAVNDCQEARARAVVTTDFSALARCMGLVFNERLRPRTAACGALAQRDQGGGV